MKDPTGLTVYYCFRQSDLIQITLKYYGLSDREPTSLYPHSWICVDNQCAGLYPDVNSPLGGSVSTQDRFSPSQCKEMKLPCSCSQENFESCVKSKLVNFAPDRYIRPDWLAPLGSNCTSWAQGLISLCASEACKK